MDIPVQNVYYLLCYAWDKLDERDIVDVDTVGLTELVDLFARVLVRGVTHLVKRGFDRSYVEREEWTSRLRGKILFDALARSSARTSALPCVFDELSYDVTHNRILKATARQLTRARGLAREHADALAGLVRQLSDVQDVELTARLFSKVQLHRNNRFYDFLMKVCELVHRNLLVSETSGPSKFNDFARDDKQMAALFESFVRNFYRLHSRYRVKRDDIRWTWMPADETAASLLPKMQTDVSLTAGNRKIIIDCKYTPHVTQRHYRSTADTLRSAHLYQLNAYLDNLPDADATCEAMLLYPTTDVTLSASYTYRHHKVSIRTVDLGQPWQGIHADLLALVA
jgi:5-methylcytosine-specific restriction enzyme subunit McrC